MPKNGAQEKTRTSTTLRPLAPEASASTNSATWAFALPVSAKRSEGMQFGPGLVNSFCRFG
jgi:hypothetical protein